MTTSTSEQESKKGPFQQIKPRWIAENLALAGLGFGLGHLGGGALAGYAAGHPKVQQLSPEARRRIVQGAKLIGGAGGAGTGFALNQMRLAMNERLLRKKREHDKKTQPPTPEKVASVLLERGWR